MQEYMMRESKKLSLDDMFKTQREFMSLFHDLDEMTPRQREELTKTLVLGLHGEATSLANCVNYRDHRHGAVNVSKSKLTHEAVDVIRYTLGVLNAWGISPEQFAGAYRSRDVYLTTRRNVTSQPYAGQPAIIVDMDDVIAGFRDGFTDWLNAKGVPADRNSTEYYYISSLTGNKNFNSERYYQDFIEEHGLRDLLAPIQNTIDAINKLYDDGYWIQILTARPDDNPTCVYDTYEWLKLHGLKFNRVDFAGEKFLWLMKSEPFDAGRVVCALDDSSKHALDYAKHGVHVFAPVMSYNMSIRNTPGITMYTSSDDLYEMIVTYNTVCAMDKLI
jgi:hypothetical protein